MGDRRFGRGSNLTSSQAKELLPIPTLWVLIGLAEPIFQESTRSNRGSLVEIRQTRNHGNLTSSYGVFSPITLSANQWEKGVLPVLTNPLWDPSTPINRSLIQHNINEFLRLLGIELEKSFIQAGYGKVS